MIEQKQNDWVLNILGNQGFSTADFKSVGLTTENTSLLEEDVYKRSKQIQENPLFQNPDGTFNSESFHKFYEGAEKKYNLLANETYLDQMAQQQIKYGKDDIFAPAKQRRTFAETVSYGLAPNPDRTATGLIRVGETSKPKRSRSEIAQTQKVLDNPTEVYNSEGVPNWSKAKWSESPNDSWFTDFFDTRVLAQWESDGVHIDPVTGQEVKHVKGEAKLNENGTYFYENLDGRDVYGKQVLNKMNTLTTDGSVWNKYDFFDSDDLDQKSIGGSIMKNLALVGTMFIPYVGPWVAGVSIATQLAGLSATLGKMFLGSDSPTLSAIEGWAKSVNRQTAKSQYAQENTWCWENFIGLIGDVAGQLKEQRFIFEFGPAITKGNKVLGWNGVKQSKVQKLADQKAKEYHNLLDEKLSKLTNPTKNDFAAFSAGKQGASIKANNEIQRFMDSYNNLGKVLSMGYMTALTVGDTYGEAKYYGNATDAEATILTLGYAAMELMLLNSDLGKWILPELKASGVKNKAIINALTKGREANKNINTSTSEGKKNFIKNLFNAGKKAAQEAMSGGKNLTGMVISGGLAEGLEETSEELLADFSKSCFNTWQWLQGDEGRMTAWDNIWDRYSMSLIGGALGGGLTAAGTNFKVSTQPLTTEQAKQELIYKIKNGEEEDILKTLDKMQISSKDISFDYQEQSDGTIIEKPSDKNTKSQDEAIKNVFRQEVKMLKDIITAEGAKITDNEFIDIQTFKDLRLAWLASSPVSGIYLQDFLSLNTRIADLVQNIRSTQKKVGDSGELSELDQQQINQYNKELTRLRKRKDDYLQGKLAQDYVAKSLMSFHTFLNNFYTTSTFDSFVKAVYHGAKVSDLSDSEIKEAKEKFDQYKQGEWVNQIGAITEIYLDMARNFGSVISDFSEEYEKLRSNETLADLMQSKMAGNQHVEGLMTLGALDEQNYVEQLQKWYKEVIGGTLAHLMQSELQSFVENDKNLQNQLQEAQSQLQEAQNQLEELKKDSETNKDSIEAQNIVIESLKNNINDLKNNIKLNNQEGSLALTKELLRDPIKHLAPIFNEGVINPEIREDINNSLYNILNIVDSYINDIDEVIKSLENFGTLEELEEMGEFDFSIKNLLLRFNQLEKLFDLISKDLPENISDIDKLKTLKKSLQFRKNKLNENRKSLSKVPYTNVIKLIQNYINTNSESKLNLGNLLERVNQIINSNITDLNSANFDEIYEDMKEVVQVINWLSGLIYGSQYDSELSTQNFYSYNATLNEIAEKNKVEGWIPLPQINVHNSQVILQDLNLIKDKLQQAINLYRINQGKKLIQQDKAATNKDFIIYNRINRWIVNVDDDWVGKKELETLINESENLSKLAEKREQKGISPEKRQKISEEMFKIENALYDFFQKNKNRLKSEGKKLFAKDFNLYNHVNPPLNEDSERLGDRDFLCYLSSRMALKRADFNNMFSQSLNPEDGKAPLPTQEEAVFQNIAHVINMPDKNILIDAYLEAVRDDYNSKTEEQRDKLIKSLDSQIITKDYLNNVEAFIKLPQFIQLKNFQLTEGDPGAGKSDAVSYFTAQILKKFYNKEILSNVLIAHSTNANAKKYANNIGIENSTPLDHDELMDKIVVNYNPARNTDKQGNKLYDKTEFSVDNEVYKHLGQIRALSEKEIPSVIIIDEISHYDQVDLEKLQEFAERYNIPILASGDFMQSTISSVIDLGNKVRYDLTPEIGIFAHCPKLGISMRTGNSQMDKSIASVKNQIETKNNLSKLHTFYNETDNELYGVKVLKSSEQKEIKETLEKLIKSKKEKIGFIYNLHNPSPLLKIIQDNYAEHFTSYPNTSAQGLEGQYYVVDSSIYNAKHIYTAITRASQGVLLVTDKDEVDYNSEQESITTFSKNNITGLQNYSKNRKKVLNENKSDNIPIINKVSQKVPPIKKREKREDVKFTQKTTNSISELGENAALITIDSITYATNGERVFKIASNTSYEEITKEQDKAIFNKVLEIFNNLEKNSVLLIPTGYAETVSENNNNEQRESDIVLTDKAENYIYRLHSFNTSEQGVQTDNQGNIIYLTEDGSVDLDESQKQMRNKNSNTYKRYKYRVDGIFGLIKLKKGKDWNLEPGKLSEYSDAYKILHDYLVTTPEISSETIEKILEELNPNLEVSGIEFGVISRPLPKQKIGEVSWGVTKAGIYSIFDRSSKETKFTQENNKVDTPTDLSTKTISAVITFENGQILTMPLFTLNNLATYVNETAYNDPDKKDEYRNTISGKLTEIYINTDRKGGYDFHKAILNSNLPDKLKNIARLFIYTQTGYFKLPEDFTPSKYFENYGLQVVTAASSSGLWEVNSVSIPVKEYAGRFTISKKIYTAQNTFDNGLEFAHRGHLFVLMSDSTQFTNDEALEEYYKKQLNDSTLPKLVSVVYIVPPKVTIEQYLENLQNILNKNEEGSSDKTILPLGDTVTSYKLLKEIYNFDKSLLSDKIQKHIEELIETEKNSNEDDLYNKLLTNSEEDRNPIPLKLLFNRELVRIYEYKRDVVNKLRELEKEGKISIYYNPRFANRENAGNNIITPMQQDSDGSYTINELPFVVNALIRPTMLSVKGIDTRGSKTFDEVIKELVDQIEVNDKFISTRNTKSFVDSVENSVNILEGNVQQVPSRPTNTKEDINNQALKDILNILDEKLIQGDNPNSLNEKNIKDKIKIRIKEKIEEIIKGKAENITQENVDVIMKVIIPIANENNLIPFISSNDKIFFKYIIDNEKQIVEIPKTFKNKIFNINQVQIDFADTGLIRIEHNEIIFIPDPIETNSTKKESIEEVVTEGRSFEEIWKDLNDNEGYMNNLSNEFKDAWDWCGKDDPEEFISYVEKEIMRLEEFDPKPENLIKLLEEFKNSSTYKEYSESNSDQSCGVTN